MLKKILIAAIIFFLIAIGVVVYFMFIKDRSATPEGQTPEEYLPFGPDSGTRPDGTSGSLTETPTGFDDGVVVPLADLMQLYNEPVAGATMLQTRDGTVVRFMERSNAHVHDINLSTGLISRVSNTTIPKIYEALWPDFNTVILRYLTEDGNTLKTYAAILASSTQDKTVKELRGSFLNDNIESLVLSPSGKKIFSLELNDGGSIGTVSNPNGSTRTTVLNSSLREWLPSWVNESTVSLTTKPSSNVLGTTYLLNTATKGQTKIVGGAPGQTINIDPTATHALLGANNLNLYIYTPKTDTTTNTNLKTLPEKCVWSTKRKSIAYCGVPSAVSGNTFPESWYQGIVLFSDNIYEVNTETNTASILINLKGVSGRDIDLVNPILSKDENYLIFGNKRDLSLWSYRIGSSTPVR